MGEEALVAVLLRDDILCSEGDVYVNIVGVIPWAAAATLISSTIDCG